jgi:hypothetical protein
MFITAIAAFVTAYYFVNVAMIHIALKRAFKYPFGKRMKPVDCVQCLSVWIAIILFFLPEIYSQALLVFFGAGFLGTKIK